MFKAEVFKLPGLDINADRFKFNDEPLLGDEPFLGDIKADKFRLD